MWLFKGKQIKKVSEQVQNPEKTASISFEPSVLRQNNISRLSIDERWTKLFVTIRMSPQLEQAEKEMNELIKKEAMLQNEQDNLEPQKRRCMNEIMNLTKEAFEDDNKDAKERLKDCKKEIEKINNRMNDVQSDIEKLNEALKAANFKLLTDSAAYIFSTLKDNKDRAREIKNELILLEEKEKSLRQELETISVDWTHYATDLTELIGTDQVKRLEEQFGLEGMNDEASDA